MGGAWFLWGTFWWHKSSKKNTNVPQRTLGGSSVFHCKDLNQSWTTKDNSKVNLLILPLRRVELIIYCQIHVWMKLTLPIESPTLTSCQELQTISVTQNKDMFKMFIVLYALSFMKELYTYHTNLNKMLTCRPTGINTHHFHQSMIISKDYNDWNFSV